MTTLPWCFQKSDINSVYLRSHSADYITQWLHRLKSKPLVQGSSLLLDQCQTYMVQMVVPCIAPFLCCTFLPQASTLSFCPTRLQELSLCQAKVSTAFLFWTWHVRKFGKRPTALNSETQEFARNALSHHPARCQGKRRQPWRQMKGRENQRPSLDLLCPPQKTCGKWVPVPGSVYSEDITPRIKSLSVQELAGKGNRQVLQGTSMRESPS
jgi:hypothetical protein